MSLTIATEDAEALRSNLLWGLDHQAVGEWKRDGESFTVTAPEWSGKAWVRAFAEPGQLVLGLVPSEGDEMSDELYVAFHVRLVEMLLTHFSGQLSSVTLTARLTYPDLTHWIGEGQHEPRHH